MRSNGKTYALFKQFRDEYSMKDCIIICGSENSLDCTFREASFLCACYSCKVKRDKHELVFPNNATWKFVVLGDCNKLIGTNGPYCYEQFNDQWYCTERRFIND